jgi:ABC-type lipoprotein export system ATPase subunit
MAIPGASVIELRAVSQMAGAGAPLAGISMSIVPGSVTLLRGEPGSGARELLRILGLVEAPESGSVLVEGVSTEGWSEERRADFRNSRFGFLLPAPFLLPALSVVENVAMPIFKRFSKITPEEAGRRVNALLTFAGLEGYGESAAGELGTIEQHRVAIARALANEPAMLIVEELDGSLSGDALQQVLALLRQAASEKGVAVAGTVSARFASAPPGVRLLDLVQGRLQAEAPLAGAPLN